MNNVCILPFVPIQDGFVEFFHVSDPESSVRTALTTIVTVAGIGAVLAYLTR